MRTFLPLFSLLLCLTACSNNADEESVENNTPETIYHDFQVWAEEGSEEVTVRLQFRAGGKEGDALLVGPPDGVLLDNLPLVVD
ncbi:MAG: hypothetical protein M3Q06_15210, partial [Bacteroidota bacterium]|nr:hypothetical protein [Bacteroidota bacterium]